METNYFS